MHPRLSELLDYADTTRSDLLAAVSTFPTAQWNAPAADGGWSLAQQLTHLYLVEHSSVRAMFRALKDAKKVKAAGLKPKVEDLLALLERDPFQNPPAFEKLVGDLAGAYSRRINIHNRLVYEVFAKERVVRILRMWTHYE